MIPVALKMSHQPLALARFWFREPASRERSPLKNSLAGSKLLISLLFDGLMEVC